MVEKSELACIVWECTCSKEHLEFDYEPEKKFIIIDEDGDPSFYCDICGAEGNHLPITTDKTESPCWRCKGTGKAERFNYLKDRREKMKCVTCDGTGIQKYDHRKRVIGRVSKEDLIKLASQDPRGWNDHV